MNKKLLLLGLVFLLLISSAFATLNDAEIYYSFDDADLTGSNPNDLSGNGNNGVTFGGTTVPTSGETGILEQAFSYDGTGDYMSTGYNMSTDTVNITPLYVPE
jgi:hypothetical protein